MQDQKAFKCPHVLYSMYRSVIDICYISLSYLQSVPKKVSVKPIFEFQTLGGVFLGVKNNSKNFENQKKVDSLAKF